MSQNPPPDATQFDTHNSRNSATLGPSTAYALGPGLSGGEAASPHPSRHSRLQSAGSNQSQRGSAAYGRQSGVGQGQGQGGSGVLGQGESHGYHYPHPLASPGGEGLGLGRPVSYGGSEAGGTGSGKSPVLLGSLGFGIIAFLTTLISQSILTHDFGASFLGGYLWFAIIMQLIILVWFTASLFSSPPPSSYAPGIQPHPFAAAAPTLANLSSIVIVFAALAIDRHITSGGTAVQHATAAGWLLILLVDLFWVVYLSSPATSFIHGFVHRSSPGAGTEKAAGGVPTGKAGKDDYVVNPYPPPTNGAPGQGGEQYPLHPIPPTSPLLPPHALALRNSHPGSGAGSVGGRESDALTGASIDGTRRTSAAISEGRSIDTAGVERDRAGAGVGVAGLSGGAPTRTGILRSESGPGERDDMYRPPPAEDRLGVSVMMGVDGGEYGVTRVMREGRERESGGTGGSGTGTGTPGGTGSGTPAPGYTSRIEEEDEGHGVVERGEKATGDKKDGGAGGGQGGQGKVWRARALYSYKASTHDPNELSFQQGETLEIVDKSGRWWSARRGDGGVGIAPSNYLQLL